MSGILERHGPKEHGIDDAEDRGIRTDAEHKGKQRNDGEAGAIQQDPGGEADVLQKTVHRVRQGNWRANGTACCSMAWVGRVFGCGTGVDGTEQGARCQSFLLRPVNILPTSAVRAKACWRSDSFR